MTVYVDDIIDWGDIARAKGLRWTFWCHCTADTEAELEAMATKLKLKREWLQDKDDWGWHYDLVPSKRTLAIKYGAKPISCIEMGRIFNTRLESRRT